MKDGRILWGRDPLLIIDVVELAACLLPMRAQAGAGFISGGGGGRGAQGPIGPIGPAGPPGLAAPRLFDLYSDQLDNPVNSDWAVNALAPSVADSINPGLSVRRFDDTIEEGVGFAFEVPAGSVSMRITLWSRPQTAPPVDVTVLPRIYTRQMTDGAPISAWSAAFAMAAIAMPELELNWQRDQETITLAALGIAVGQNVQFEFTRNPADTLVGDWDLNLIVVEFLP
jgi:hypothetical protein